MATPCGDHTSLLTNKTLKNYNEEQLEYWQIYTIHIQNVHLHILSLPILKYHRLREYMILLYWLITMIFGYILEIFSISSVTSTR